MQSQDFENHPKYSFCASADNTPAPVKIAYFSDTHLEMNRFRAENFQIDRDTDVIVLPGDIVPRYSVDSDCLFFDDSVFNNVLDFFGHIFSFDIPVVYIMGNHEHYDSSLHDTQAYLNQFFLRIGTCPDFYFLEKSSVFIKGVLFCGATLWTDYDHESPVVKMTAQKQMADFRYIRVHGRKTVPDDFVDEFNASVSFLEREASAHPDARKVFVTHHLPHPECVHVRYRTKGNSDINGAFMSDLSGLISRVKPDAWIHGHTHTPVTVDTGDSLILCNPFGYPGAESARFNGVRYVTV